MTVQQSTQQLLFSLFHIYEEREARNIADLVMECVTGWKRIDRVLNKQVPLSREMEILLAGYTEELLEHKPVQYVLHEAWFYEMKFYVDEHVLIPRPETEELVRWVIEVVRSSGPGAGSKEAGVGSRESGIGSKEAGVGSRELGVGSGEPFVGAGLAPALAEISIQGGKSGLDSAMVEKRQGQVVSHITILDIGTGSGCIAITLKKKLPGASIIACDVSKQALAVAAGNAQANKTPIEFALCDFLDVTERKALPVTDIIVSNPPYVPRSEKETMQPHVTAYEPHLALFVADNDPLLFYKEIAVFAQTHLSETGQIFVELHEDMGNAVGEVFRLHGFNNLEFRQDMQGKNRMLKAASKSDNTPPQHP